MKTNTNEETNKIYKTKVKIITPPSSCQSSSNDGDFNFYNIMFIGSEEYVTNIIEDSQEYDILKIIFWLKKKLVKNSNEKRNR